LRLVQEKPTQITQAISDTQFYAIEAELERLIAEEKVADAEVVEDRASCPLRKSARRPAVDAGTRTTPVCALNGCPSS
jgi:hypothetical protein